MIYQANISSESTSRLSNFIKKHPFRGRARILSLLSRLNLSGKTTLKTNNNIIPLNLKYAGDIGMFLHEELPHEKGLLKILMQILTPNDVFYDIGANVGYYTAIVSSLKIPTIAFEPNKSLSNRFEWLLKNNDNVRLFTIGLSDTNDNLTFNVSENDHSLANFRPSEQKDHKKSLTVSPLHEVIKNHSLPQPTIIKIDVEGFEYKVLQGYGSDNMKYNKPIIFMEYIDNFALSCGYDFTDLKEFCKVHGYKILRIENEGFLRSENIEEALSGNDLILVHEESDRINIISSLIKDNAAIVI